MRDLMTSNIVTSNIVRPVVLAAALAVGSVFVTPPVVQAAELVATFNDWSVFSHSSPKKICFVASQPKEKLPRGAKRAPSFFYISAWPGDGVKSEVSIRLGYPIKAQSNIKVSIGPAAFNLYPKVDKAFVADATQELKLIEAMKKGSFMSVSAVSQRGTQTTDKYSLVGISAALKKLVEACP